MAAATAEMRRRQEEAAAAMSPKGIFAKDQLIFPGLTEEGKAKAKAHSAEVTAALLDGVKSVQFATDGLTAAETRYFQAIERSVQGGAATRRRR
jgi:hypothetical protein